MSCLIQNPAEEIKRIARSLNKDIADDVVIKIAEMCSFNSLKKFKDGNDPTDSGDISKEELGKREMAILYRKGS